MARRAMDGELCSYHTGAKRANSLQQSSQMLRRLSPAANPAAARRDEGGEPARS